MTEPEGEIIEVLSCWRRCSRRTAAIIFVMALWTPPLALAFVGARIYGVTFTVAGLLLDILGAATLTFGVLRVTATDALRRGVTLFDQNPSWRTNLPGVLAKRFGESYLAVMDTRDLEDSFLGLLMFIGGFMGQVGGAIISTVSR